MPIGRPRKPTLLKVIEGQRGHRALRRDVDPVGSIGTPPQYLSEDQKAFWKQVTGSMPDKVYRQADRGTLERYVVAWDEFRRMTRELEAAGFTVEGAHGGMAAHPLIAARRSIAQDMHRTAQELGLTPAARSRVEIDAPPAKQDPAYQRLIGAA